MKAVLVTSVTSVTKHRTKSSEGRKDLFGSWLEYAAPPWWGDVAAKVEPGGNVSIASRQGGIDAGG